MVEIKLAKFFFDRPAVIKAVGRCQARAMSRMGAFLRTRARSLLRKRKKSSGPGQPPSDHGGALKRLLFFAYDPSSKTTVVGPEKFGPGFAPHALEFGDKESRNGRTLAYAPRPFMKPALAAEVRAGTLPRAWANSIKGS